MIESVRAPVEPDCVVTYFASVELWSAAPMLRVPPAPEAVVMISTLPLVTVTFEPMVAVTPLAKVVLPVDVIVRAVVALNSV